MMRAVLNNLGWKVFSVLAALALWATFIGSPELVMSVSAPVEFQNMPQGLELSSETPGRVYLDIQGPSTRLRGLDVPRTAVILNLANIQAGERTFNIESRNVDLPVGLNLLRSVPSQVRLKFERSTGASIPIKARFSHPPPEGYRVASQVIHPPTLRIEGPESRVRQVAYAETDPIDLTNFVGTTRFQVHTYVPDPLVRYVSSTVVQVTVNLEKTQGGASANGSPAAVRN